MAWLDVCSKDVMLLIIFDQETLDHERYIKEVLPVAKTHGDKIFGNDWMAQDHTYISGVRITSQILLIATK